MSYKKKEYYLLNDYRLTPENVREASGDWWDLNFHNLKGLKKRDKVGVIIVDDEDKIIKPLTVPGKPNDIVVFTVEFVTEEVCRLFQVGEYEKPIVFSLFDGRAHNLPYREHHYKFWHNRVLVKVE
jgi:hypothetical protein